MRPFASILVVFDDPTEGSSALWRALEIAKRDGSALTLVHAFEGYAAGFTGALDALEAVELERIELEARRGYLEELADRCRREGIVVSTSVLLGTPFLEIIREVLRGRHDLLMKEARSGGGIASRLFTSLDLHLMRKCPCPVWISKAGRRERQRRVLAAVDPDPGDPARRSLNERIVDLAVSIASREEGEVQVVHAWQLRSEPTLRRLRAATSDDYVDELVTRELKEHTTLVHRLVAPFRGHFVTIHVELVKGEPGKVLPAVARQFRADLIVMGTVGRSGIPGLLIGNTAETVLHEVNCSVLVVKPDGFVSPVRLEEAGEDGRGAGHEEASSPLGREVPVGN